MQSDSDINDNNTENK